MTFLIIWGCSIEKDPLTSDTNKILQIDSVKAGFMRIKVTPELASSLAAATDNSGNIAITRVKSINDPLQGIDIISMKRTFTGPIKFEARKHTMGLDLWYDVEFNKSTPLTKAYDELSNIQGVTEVEFEYPIKLESSTFNDPKLGSQWHYINTGATGSQGIDINVSTVWENYTTGSSNVIVAVVDGGIDYTHEDLASNMFINSAEYNGTTNVDDDKNGYIDDVYGFNFLRNTKLITPDNHGTHVAGTIGAVNNNGIGVCGIAGGNAAKGIKGVRLLSCQIFDSTTGDDNGGNGAKAIVYGADNGAVICQNSWGYTTLTETPNSMKNAIDYFTTYAGLDENGQQIGPMAGGIVIFAAGNEASEILGSPAHYEKAMAVAAVGSSGKKASYSNYGDWVDICAPGGDSGSGAILSTLPNNSYGTMQGTSMACPHVSGVAALLVSYHGGPGFTAKALWNMLINGVKDVYQYNTTSLQGKLGAGLLDATKSIASVSNQSPDKIPNVDVSVKSNAISCLITVPADPDDVKASNINIYYSKSVIPSDFNRKSLPTAILKKTFAVGEVKANEKLNCIIDNLDFETNYYLAADASDISGNLSEVSILNSVKTLVNQKPVIDPANTTITLKSSELKSVILNISDPDNQKLTWSFTSGSNAATATESNGKITVTINAGKATAGTYTATLKVTDSYDYTEGVIIYTILPNHAPVIYNTIEDICFNSKTEKKEFSLSDLFKDEDNDVLSYSATVSNNAVVQVNAANGKLYINALSYGNSDIIIKAKDGLGASCEISFKVLVRDNSKEIDIYPNPVTDYLYFRTGTTKSSNLVLYNVAGAKVFEGTITSSPFEPYKLDMRNFDGGAYTVKVESYTTKIVKL